MSMLPFVAIIFLTYVAGFFHGRISLRNEHIRELEDRIKRKAPLR